MGFKGDSGGKPAVEPQGVVPPPPSGPPPDPLQALESALGKPVAPPAGGGGDLPLLQGTEWEAFKSAHPELAADIQACDECLRDLTKMENRLEDVWGSLRKNLRRASSEGFLEQVPGKIQV